jgi:hypothetical protein
MYNHVLHGVYVSLNLQTNGAMTGGFVVYKQPLNNEFCLFLSHKAILYAKSFASRRNLVYPYQL